MKRIVPILLSIIFLLIAFLSKAQTIERYNTFSYSVNEGLLQSTIANIAVDKNNFCWISFPIGIQKFDGKKFIDIPVQNGLPDNKGVHFFKCSNGNLLISNTAGISKYEIANNNFTLIYKNAPTENKQIIFIGEDEAALYFFTQKGSIKSIDINSGKLIKEVSTNLPRNLSVNSYTAIFSDNIINHKVGINLNFTLYLWDLKQGRLLASSTADFSDMAQYMLHLKSENEILYISFKTNNGLASYHFFTQKKSTLFIPGKDDKQIGRCNMFPWKNKLLISINNRLFETDTSFTSLKTELVDFQNQSIAGTSSISGGGIKEDNYGNLYIQTVNAGIKKIIGNNYPVKYYGTLKKEDNNILSLLADKQNNRVLAGTVNNGLLIFDTQQNLIKHIKVLPGKKLPFSPNCIVKNNKGDYLLFIVGEKQLWLLKKDFSTFVPFNIISSLPENRKGIHYFGNFLFQNKDAAVIQTQGKFYKTNFTNNTVSEYEVSSAYVMGGLLYKNYIIIHGNDELVFFDAATFLEVKRVPFNNTGYVRCFTQDKLGNIFIGSNNGIYKITENGKILAHFTKQNGLPDDCIYAMHFDNEAALWCSTNKGIFRMNKDNNIFVLRKEDGLQENEFNTNVAAKADDGEMFFGGVNGISSFYPASINKIKDSVSLVCTQIKVNNKELFTDTAAWNIDKITLPYYQNLLSFDFVAMGNNNPNQYVYQYKMDGIDEQWLQNEDLQTVRYFLPPGKYAFKIFASRFFDKDAKPMKEIRIVIHAPFYKTWWFFMLVALLFAGIMMYAINRFNKNKYRKKLIELENEHKIQLERERISRDLHDSLGAYANAVLYNTELLQKEEGITQRNELMNDLKFASKDIITSLRETVWALKKDSYTAEECLLRIKNFIQPLSKYYVATNFNVDAENIDKTLLHSKALHVVRIVQEAVTNAIKHAAAKNIIIKSTIENTQWKITVSDDGKGFDYEKIKKDGQGDGLDNLKQRAVDADIILNINSVENVGTTIVLII